MKQNNILIILLLIALILRLYGILGLKLQFTNDESVTYLCATGNQEKYHGLVSNDSSYKFNTSKIEIWKSVYNINPPFCFNQIAHDLTVWDIHPPLYFWCLHFMVLIFGVHFYTGLIFNLIISFLALLVLFKLSNLIIKNKLYSLFVCVIWYLSPAVVQMDLEARHYQLLAFFTLLISYIAYEIILDKELTFSNAIKLTLIVAFGMLSHYYFAFICVGVFILFFFNFRFTKIIYGTILSFIAGFGLFLLAFPDFLNFVKNYSEGKRTVKHVQEYQSFLSKIKTQVYGALDFGGFSHIEKYFYLILILIVVTLLIYRLFKNKSSFPSAFNKPISITIYFFLWNLCFTVFLYMMDISPNQAVGEQYYSYLWPFTAILLVAAVSYIKIHKKLLFGYTLVLLVIFTESIFKSPDVKPELPFSWYDEANKADLVAIDDYDRGMFPRTIYFINNNRYLYVGDIPRLKDYDSYKRIVVFYLENKKNTTGHAPLQGYHLIRSEKCYNELNYPYFLELYEK